MFPPGRHQSKNYRQLYPRKQVFQFCTQRLYLLYCNSPLHVAEVQVQILLGRAKGLLLQAARTTLYHIIGKHGKELQKIVCSYVKSYSFGYSGSSLFLLSQIIVSDNEFILSFSVKFTCDAQCLPPLSESQILQVNIYMDSEIYGKISHIPLGDGFWHQTQKIEVE